MQKGLGRYLLPALRKKYKTVRHLKKYPPKVIQAYVPVIKLTLYRLLRLKPFKMLHYDHFTELNMVRLPMVVTMPPHAEFGRNDHREDASLFSTYEF